MQKLHPQEVDIPSYHFRIQKIIVPFHYWNPCWNISNGLSSYQKRDHVQSLYRSEFYVPTYHFEVKKTIGVSYSRLMFTIHHSLWNHVGRFYYCTPRQDFSIFLSTNPNKDHMQMLHPQEVVVPTYHLMIHKSIGVSSSRVMLRVYCSQKCIPIPSHYFFLNEKFPTISLVTQM